MKNQNNKEMKHNIESNEVKPTKKKIKISTIIIIVLVVLLLFSCVGSMGDSGTSTSSMANGTTAEDNSSEKKKEETEDEETEEPELEHEKVEEEQSTKQAEMAGEQPFDDEHLYVGFYGLYASGLLLKISDVYIEVNDAYQQAILKVDLELENTTDDAVLGMSCYDFSIYIDDYQVQIDTGYMKENDYETVSTEVNPGRKTKFVFGTVLPGNYINAEKIEVEIPGYTKTVLVKDNGVYLYGQKEAPTETNAHGESGLDQSWFENGDLYKTDDPSIILSFSSTSGGADAEVYIDYDYTHQYLLYMEDERNGYLTYMEGEERAGTLSFTMDGVVVDCGISEIDGTYWY